jgi:ABC-type transport system involved in multi-copper enzyme maturation permease subunit
MKMAQTLAMDAGESRALAPLCAVLLREFRAALLNRYVQVFSLLALGGGISAVTASETAGAAAFFLLQIALYFVSLFALLVGVSAARAEEEEWPILFAQPAPRWAFVIGKLTALSAIFSAVLALLFAPAIFTEPAPGAIAQLYANTLGLAAVFGSLGLCAGFLSHDRVQGLILSVSAWLFLLFGIDLVALLAAQWAPLQESPDAWVAVLMLNPLDAFRIQTLFALEQIPAEAANKTPLANWWLTHAGLWLAILSTAWTAGLLLVTNRHLTRTEI